MSNKPTKRAKTVVERHGYNRGCGCGCGSVPRKALATGPQVTRAQVEAALARARGGKSLRLTPREASQLEQALDWPAVAVPQLEAFIQQAAGPEDTP